MKFVGVAVTGLCALVAIGAGVARATGGGGDKIASAPLVTADAQQAGSTASFSDSCQNGYEFWKLQLEQGDLVKITWGSPAAVDTVALFPVGTSDSDNSGCEGLSAWTSVPTVSDTNGTPATTRVTQIVVPADGTYPLLFLDTTGTNNAGAYAFTAVVLHGSSVTLPHVLTLPTNGILTASALAPDSSPITDAALKLTLRGLWGKPQRWHKLATATPTDGSAAFTYSVPVSAWGKKIRLQISGGGSSYQPVTSPKESVKVEIPPAGPVIASRGNLKAVSKLLRQPIYWAGPRKGYHYEFTITENGYAYVRYLPHGVGPGAHGSNFLVIATYPFPGAYSALKKYSKGKAVAGPNGSIYYAQPGSSTSVYVAFPNLNYEMEVYDPSPKVARAIVTSGALRPVR